MVETKYCVFEIREGLLKVPEISYYGRPESIFEEYNSRKEAEKAISESDESRFSTFVILPLTNKNKRKEK